MINADVIEEVLYSAFRRRNGRSDVVFVQIYLPQCIRIIYEMLEDGSWRDHLEYRDMLIHNKNNKDRKVKSPKLLTLFLQHLAIYLIADIYSQKDNNVGLNCKPEHGITASIRRNSLVKRLKHIYYDRRDLEYAVIIDQRKCYQHMKEKVARKALKQLVSDKWTRDFIISVSFVNGTLPIGTPSSPPIHHVIMLSFDLWVQEACPLVVRYADDLFLPFSSKEEAQQMLWRIKNYWWYVYGVRAKSQTQRVVRLSKKTDFCGFVFHRNKNKHITSHDKGYVSIRHSIMNSALHCKTNESYASYYGIMKHADMYNIMRRIELNMNLRELTQKIKINRELDAENIEMKELATSGVEFTIYDYDLRKDAKGTPNWIKCLIGIPEIDKNTNEPTGRILAREFHGGADAIVKFHVECEKMFCKKKLLPMTGMIMEQRCGYIYQGSTNMMETIDSSYYDTVNAR